MNKGFIKISNDVYVKMWGTLYIIFKDFRPTHIEFRHWENDIWYFYGTSDLFDEVKEGDIIPQYDVLLTRNEDSAPLTYEFIKMK